LRFSHSANPPSAAGRSLDTRKFHVAAATIARSVRTAALFRIQSIGGNCLSPGVHCGHLIDWAGLLG
jgi:hypothetical protein